jgi:hypothetical protein
MFLEVVVAIVVTSDCRILARVEGCMYGSAVPEGFGIPGTKVLREFSSNGTGDADNGTTTCCAISSSIAIVLVLYRLWSLLLLMDSNCGVCGGA